MRKFDVNKIVRDDSYSQMAKECTAVVCEDIDLADFQEALKEKLLEEAEEVMAEKSNEGLTEEIADILEVVDGLINAYGLDKAEIERIKTKKFNAKGGFKTPKRCIYLIADSTNPTHHDLIEYCVTRPEKYPETSTTLFSEPPHGFKADVEVAACYITCKDKILLLKRAAHKPEGNQWGVPGGKLDEGETPLHSAMRELFEETGLQCDATAFKPVSKVYASRPTLQFVYHMFALNFETQPEIVLSENEHKTYQWVSLEEAAKLPLMGGALDSLFIFQDYLQAVSIA